jgi:hypothetical protein
VGSVVNELSFTVPKSLRCIAGRLSQRPPLFTTHCPNSDLSYSCALVVLRNMDRRRSRNGNVFIVGLSKQCTLSMMIAVRDTFPSFKANAIWSRFQTPSTDPHQDHRRRGMVGLWASQGGTPPSTRCGRL